MALTRTPDAPESPQHGTDTSTVGVLEAAIALLEAARAPAAAIGQLRHLAGQVGEPCVVAVVGLVNAGKSTFVNALLQQDMAVVGNTETTATINHFVYGEPAPELPVRCHWRSGRVSHEPAEFPDSLQGRDTDALRRADTIDRLEYLFPSPMLRGITLVDTPGTGATVTEHVSRTAEFLNLSRGLRERHDRETQHIRDTADAIVYLVGAVARVDDQQLLTDFGSLSGGAARAMNAIGVIAKVDLSDELTRQRGVLAARVAHQLDRQLNTVVPVSAGLSRALDRTGDDTLAALATGLRRIPAQWCDFLLRDEELFLDYENGEIPLSPADRSALRESVPGDWRVFATIAAESLRQSSAGALRAALAEIAGFGELRRLLRDHFLARATLLRCYRILVDAHRLLRSLRYQLLLPRQRQAAAETQRLLAFQRSLDARHADLSRYLAERMAEVNDGVPSDTAWSGVEEQLERLLRRLEEDNADFTALQALDNARADFTDAEAAELRALFGMNGIEPARRLGGAPDVAACARAQLRWRVERDSAAGGSPRHVAADRAYVRLGILLAELEYAVPDSGWRNDDR
jgi:hypothetical protein